jgi:hypothetical protein
MTDDIKTVATAFECVKIAMSQSKDGHILKLAIHPNDIPESVIRDLVGTRYQLALVRLDDESKPVASAVDEAGKKAVKIAGTLCGDENFQQYLAQMGYAEEMSESAASTYVREWCGISSRKELQHNSEARERLSGLREEFIDWLRRGGLSR